MSPLNFVNFLGIYQVFEYFFIRKKKKRFGFKLFVWLQNKTIYIGGPNLLYVMEREREKNEEGKSDLWKV